MKVRSQKPDFLVKYNSVLFYLSSLMQRLSFNVELAADEAAVKASTRF